MLSCYPFSLLKQTFMFWFSSMILHEGDLVFLLVYFGDVHFLSDWGCSIRQKVSYCVVNYCLEIFKITPFLVLSLLGFGEEGLGGFKI